MGILQAATIYGKATKEAVRQGKRANRQPYGAQTSEILFTSGGTESNNHAIIGTAFANMEKGKHIITSKVEHPAVLETVRYLQERFDFKVTYLPVDKYGMVNPLDVENAITSRNNSDNNNACQQRGRHNQPYRGNRQNSKRKKLTFHTDAAQSCGKIPVNVNA